MEQIARILTVKPERDFKLLLGFADGSQRRFDASHLLGRGVFAELADWREFSKVRVEGSTVCWADEIDLCPTMLFEQSVEVYATF
jgi:Protein of unknown function (DUF2442)